MSTIFFIPDDADAALSSKEVELHTMRATEIFQMLGQEREAFACKGRWKFPALEGIAATLRKLVNAENDSEFGIVKGDAFGKGSEELLDDLEDLLDLVKDAIGVEKDICIK